jgi:hypothetical protein
MADYKRPTSKVVKELGKTKIEFSKQGKISRAKQRAARRKAYRRQGEVLARRNTVDYIKIDETTGKLYKVSEDLYLRDVVETNHAVYSGKTSIAELRVKYAKFKK